MIKIYHITLLIIGFTASIFMAGCSDESTSLSFPKSELPVVSFQGFDIPQFPTARGQLNYAKSGFAFPGEKKAAFNILFNRFPKARLQCGNAALYLAYMNFGYDYRFATQQDYIAAIKAYHDVIKNFKTYPKILVKAYWYLGWIYCDLLHKKETGLPYFWHIVSTWPDLKMGISSPVPWVSLVYPLTATKNKPIKSSTDKHWASLSLLEIIRHSTDETDILKAFNILWQDYQNTVSTGLAIKRLLCDQRYAQKIIPYSKKYLALNIANPYMAREIKANAEKY